MSEQIILPIYYPHKGGHEGATQTTEAIFILLKNNNPYHQILLPKKLIYRRFLLRRKDKLLHNMLRENNPANVTKSTTNITNIGMQREHISFSIPRDLSKYKKHFANQTAGTSIILHSHLFIILATCQDDKSLSTTAYNTPILKLFYCNRLKSTP